MSNVLLPWILLIICIGLLILWVRFVIHLEHKNGVKKYGSEESYLKAVEKIREESEKNKPRCPTCGSDNISKIDTLERGVSVAAFGLASGKVGKQFKCKNCGYKW